ncbi:hypothetical protein [Prescottella agglutinans]|uniref:Uncharacterized protein n=1 Tax=Prescottella agglutinans TaxID=1644129 RepID=A0ABT6MK86_9NOCA|nr:hypothetical protein [Prescottella agglutinans]MDH6284294.1 hypothetical protein [Prescottella agglutinans]
MPRDWLSDAETALAGAVDRVAASETRVTELLGTSIDPVALPQRWTIDRALLPKSLADKLARREALGLPVPIHAHGASDIAAHNRAEWENITWRYMGELKDSHLSRRLPPPEPSPGKPLSGPVTKRQLAELRARLPHTDDTSTPTTTSLVGRLVDRCHSDGEINYAMPAFAALLFGIFFTVGLTAALGTAAVLIVLVSVADIRTSMRRRTELTGADYRDLERATIARPGPQPGTRECQLAQIAATLAAHITGCPAWGSDDLAMHRIQLGPDAESAQVTEQAAEISRIRATLGPAPAGDSDAATRAREQRDATEQILDAVTDSLTRRVAALYRYAAELSALNTDYVALQTVEQSLAAGPDLEALVARTGVDELTARQLDRLTTDARDLHAAITARLSVLTGDLNALHALPGAHGDAP